MNLLRHLFNKRYRWATVLVILACAAMVRLGFWQLDRLAQRQALNAEITQKLAATPVTLNDTPITVDDPETLRYRSATVRGVFDHSQEVVLQGQSWQGQPGVNLITPLVIEGSQQAVLVDRGWIPTEAAESNQWARFATTGTIELTGLIKLSQPRPNAPPLTEPERTIFRVDIERLQGQIPYDLLPFFIVQAPTPGRTELPYRSNTDIQLSNGPHLSYAIQWFSFALILGVGYIRYLHQQAQPVRLSEIAPLSISMEA